MPRVNIYIREADWENWQKIGDKPAFISTAINLDIEGQKFIKSGGDIKLEKHGRQVSVKQHLPTPALLNDTQAATGLGQLPKPIIPKEMQPKFCKEGHPIPYGRDKCLGKGCKYA